MAKTYLLCPSTSFSFVRRSSIALSYDIGPNMVLKELRHSDTFVYSLAFFFASGITWNFQRAGYYWVASYSVLGKKKKFPAGLEPSSFRLWSGRDNHYTTETSYEKRRHLQWCSSREREVSRFFFYQKDRKGKSRENNNQWKFPHLPRCSILKFCLFVCFFKEKGKRIIALHYQRVSIGLTIKWPKN